VSVVKIAAAPSNYVTSSGVLPGAAAKPQSHIQEQARKNQ